ncbi:SPOR domain-containing protein [Acetobacter lambici]|uniref:SPOR domain-containing protein n=1 Tax=Acetobacter lambici TaxID=1332824 RepID=A0ABT1EZX0_9PROT|nr:SPOR domain-containing protein [Acetobacter lambici]MCP1243216.1 SPOR domain-containing protein [Acetobacter lambici]MCP1258502.1 SPOR domain-containing protein [Acetobacter lambici]NHO57204.1 SPOR domain-containing protein [Acetobacter lambici]
MSEDDRPSSTVEERISRARERMSMDYDDKPAPRSTTGNKLAAGNKLMDLLTSFLGSESGTRRLAYGAAGLGGLLVLGIGGWAVLGHHQSGIPVMGPPPVAMRTKPVDPGGMQLDTLALPEADANQQGHPVPAPEKPNPAALAAQYGGQPAPAGAGGPATGDAPGPLPATGAAAPAAATPAPTTQDVAQADGAALKPVPSDALPAQATAPADATAPEPLKEAPIPTDDASDGEEEAAPAPKAAAKKAATAPRGTAGKYQVQLAALQTEAEAQKEWARLKTRYPTLFGDVTPAFVRTEQNNATFYRLRVLGFGAVADAKDFCSSVRERGMACMVVRP